MGTLSVGMMAAEMVVMTAEWRVSTLAVLMAATMDEKLVVWMVLRRAAWRVEGRVETMAAVKVEMWAVWTAGH